jgi:hypothetical protein
MVETCLTDRMALQLKSVNHRSSKYPDQISLRRKFHHVGIEFSATYQLLRTGVDEAVLARRLNLYMVEAIA